MRASIALTAGLAIAVGWQATAWATPLAGPLPPSAATRTPAPPQLRAMVQGWYLADEATPDGFRIRRLNVWLTGDAAPGLGYFVTVNPARDPAKGIVQDAYAHFTLDGWRLQAGQFRVPLSSEALMLAPDLLTIRRALFNEAATQFAFQRDVGLTMNGRLWPWLELTAGAFNGDGQNTLDADHRKDVAARLVAEPGGGLRLALSHQATLLGPPGPARRRTGASIELPLGPTLARAEGLIATDGDVAKLGWYGELSGFAGPTLQLVARVEAWDPDQAQARVQRDLTLGANWFVGPLFGRPPGRDAKVAVNVVRQALPDGTTTHAALFMWQVMR